MRVRVCGTCVVCVWCVCGVCVVRVWCLCGACVLHVDMHHHTSVAVSSAIARAFTAVIQFFPLLFLLSLLLHILLLLVRVTNGYT